LLAGCICLHRRIIDILFLLLLREVLRKW